MPDDPLLTTLLDLDFAIKPANGLIVGGGYGLYLKQLYLRDNPQIRTLFGLDALPAPRTTKDIDLILRAEVATDSASMEEIRRALDELGFRVVEAAKFMQFTRAMPVGEVKIDLLSAPLGEFANRVPKDPRRVRPRPSVDLHASKLEAAIAVDRHCIHIPLKGALSSGELHQPEVQVPQAFSYLLMKLFAFRDRVNDADKNLGQHHALDVYRIVGMLTQAEDADVRSLASEFALDPTVVEARRIATECFVHDDGIGRLRIREHPLFVPALQIDRLASELPELLGGQGR